MKIEMHYPAKGDLPEPSGEMRAERHCVLAYTKSLGWTQAIRRRVGKKKFEWVCSDYDGNTLFCRLSNFKQYGQAFSVEEGQRTTS